MATLKSQEFLIKRSTQTVRALPTQNSIGRSISAIVDREKIRQGAAAGQSIKSLANQWGIARATVRDILGRGRVAKNLAASGEASC